MSGIWTLLLLLLTAVLPAIVVFFWLRARKTQVTLQWFLVSFAAGVVSLFLAAFIQSFFPHPVQGGLWQILFGVFVRIALVEEASRLVLLILLVKVVTRFKNMDDAFGAAAGLAAGLGFAAVESATYGMANISITLLRAFTAAPLHGACGLRAGTAVSIFGSHPVKAFFFFASAVFIHGAYNLMIVSPAISSLLAAAAAIIAFITSLPLLKISSK